MGDTAAQTRLWVLPIDTLVVSKASKNAAASRAFVDFVAREKQNALYSKIRGEVAPYDYQKVLNPKIGAKALPDTHQVFVPYVKATHVGDSAVWPSSAIAATFATAMQGLFTGQRTVDDVLKAVDESWPK
jgi:ABC-type glycerol-3-phosphate transport system substrate-binding protein